MKQTAFFPRVGWFTALVGLSMVAAGCGTSGGPRDLMMEEASAGPLERPVAMKGESTFLEGKLRGVATVSRGFDRGRPAAGGDRNRRQRRGEENGAFGGVFNSYGESEEDQKEAMEDYIRLAKARRAAGSPMPPVTLRVQFENKGAEPVELEVTEVNSALGNFAVRPPKLAIAPGETGTLEPMISQLGVTSDEIPLKLAVRVGDRRESQVVMVKNILSASVQKEFENLRK